MASRTPKPDLKAVDEHQRRLFCPDRHRIQWPTPMTDNRSSEYRMGGLCQAGDTWCMHRFRSYTGKPAQWRLEHAGKAGWSRSGMFKVEREDWWAVQAHDVGSKHVVTFDCSHGHFPMGSALALGREKAQERRQASYPPEIRRLAEPQAAPMNVLMQYAIDDLTEQGWDFVTEDRIRCPKCIEEEAELQAKLAKLAGLEAGSPASQAVDTDDAPLSVTLYSDAAMTQVVDEPVVVEPGAVAYRSGVLAQVVLHEAGSVERPDLGPHTLDPDAKVTYQREPKSGTDIAEYEGTQIAGIECASDSVERIVVSYGPLMARSRDFPNVQAAHEWLEANAGDLADPDVAGEL